MIRALLIFLALGLVVHAEDKPRRERIEWCDIWFTDAEKDALPRVLLIGDSITRGYFDGVEKALVGKAYCGRLTSSRSVCDPVFFVELELVLKQYPFAVIHFNNGLHGWDYTEAEYKTGMERFVTSLRALAPGARLICANTTPVREDADKPDKMPRIAERNAIAAAACSANGIPVNDLYGVIAPKPDYISGDGVHLNEEGRGALVEAVAGAVAKALPRKE